MAWSGFGPNASGLEASWYAGIIWPGFWQDATGPQPVSHFQTLFRSSTDVPDNIVQNQTGSDLVLADCVRFWPNGSGPDASQCARSIRPASGQCFPADRIQYVYWVASLDVYQFCIFRTTDFFATGLGVLMLYQC